MSPDLIIAAAVRNRGLRMGQIERLQPVAVIASAKQEEMRQLKESGRSVIREVRQTRELVHLPDFFPTPRPVIDVMLRHACIQKGMTVLEPNAGRGDLLEALRPLGVNVIAFEVVARLVEIVRAKGHDCRCADFLSISPGECPPVDLVFMNPPFGNRADEKHIRHAFTFLRPGGCLVSVASGSTTCRMADWASENDGYCVQLPSGSFKSAIRSTSVETGLVVAFRQ